MSVERHGKENSKQIGELRNIWVLINDNEYRETERDTQAHYL